MKSLKITCAIILLHVAVSFGQEANPELKQLIQKSFAYFPRLKELNQQMDIAKVR